MAKRRSLKSPSDGKACRLSWRKLLRDATVESADLITQRRRFEALWQKLSNEPGAEQSLQDVQRWFGGSAAIAVRRLMDERHESLLLVLDQIARRPADAIDSSGCAIDMSELKTQRLALVRTCGKIVKLAHREPAHKQATLSQEERPRFADVWEALESIYRTATRYDAYFSGCTYMLTDAESKMVPTLLAGTRFEPIGPTELHPNPDIASPRFF